MEYQFQYQTTPFQDHFKFKWLELHLCPIHNKLIAVKPTETLLNSKTVFLSLTYSNIQRSEIFNNKNNNSKKKI